MSLITGATAVGVGTVSTALVTVPPGPASVLLSNNGTVTAFIGAGTAVTSGNGYPLPGAQQAVIPCYAGSGGATLKVITSAGTIAAGGIGWMISTSAGGTGI